jgi:hypothetical protein
MTQPLVDVIISTSLIIFSFIISLSMATTATTIHHTKRSEVLQLTPDGFAFCHKGGVDEGSQTWSHFQAGK